MSGTDSYRITARREENGLRALLTPERWMEKPVRERYREHPAT